MNRTKPPRNWADSHSAPLERTPAELRAYARQLLDQHGLSEWNLRLDTAKRRAGLTNYQRKQISLSRLLLCAYPEAQMRDVILHEIAHAQVGAGQGHGPKWQQAAKKLGANPRACINDQNLPTPEASWVGVCPNCAHVRSLYSAPRRVTSCGACSKEFDYQRIFQWYHRGQAVQPGGSYAKHLKQIRRAHRRTIGQSSRLF